jgi:uncharacterized phage-associated protein
MSVLAAARTLGEESEWRLSPLEYQKVLYIAQMLHLAREGMPLFDEQFEAWDHGPVVPVLYRHIKAFGRMPVATISAAFVFAWGTTQAFALCDALSMTQHMSPGQLVNFTHRPGGAWETHYEPRGQNVVIPTSAMLAEWRDFTRPSQDAIDWGMRMADEIAANPQQYLDDARQRAFRARVFGEDRGQPDRG